MPVPKFVYRLLRNIVRTLLLFNDDPLFSLDVFGIKTRMEQNIGDKLEIELQLPIIHYGPVADDLPIGLGIHSSAVPFDSTPDIPRGATLIGAGEIHVFQKMMDAVVFRGFIIRAAMGENPR